MGNVFAKRMNNLGTETSFEVLARAKSLEKQGKDIIHLEIGEPDFDTPQNIKQAAIKALRNGYTHYSPAGGIPEFKETIADYVSKSRNIPVDAQEVVVTPGAKPVMFFSILALVDQGDEVIILNPGYPIYDSVIKFVGAKPVSIPLKGENNFRFDTEQVKENLTDKTKMIILNSPENPTGSVLTRRDLKAVADYVSDRDELFVMSDEIYSRIIYQQDYASIISLPGMKEKTILLDGFSKAYAMTGWRLGYGVMHRDLAQKITQLMLNSHSCTCSFTQMAGIEALTGPQDELESMVAEFKNRRDVIVSGLNDISGISCNKPLGTFYVFPNITGTELNCKELSDHLFKKAGVAVLPGTAFGKYGEGHLRLSFANSIKNIKKALHKISQTVEKL